MTMPTTMSGNRPLARPASSGNPLGPTTAKTPAQDTANVTAKYRSAGWRCMKVLIGVATRPVSPMVASPHHDAVRSSAGL
jgi:hypothetical protein